ncbi:lecithin retinol acyltransferase family protein [Burkholderia stagnalis]|uniref:lecithin retinol acyltransferase family protein n=1 Tax=Burkholderia stagnalis TaxID=1503054 RepID=UPI000F8129FE|nr:lecithin retinol acyltransferase family protein [Burkholderia stagnalis]
MNALTKAQSSDAAFDLDVPVGAHLVTRRTGYAHHGIYVGGGKVIHYAGLSRRLCGGPVEIVSIDCFAAGSGFAIIQHAAVRYSGSEVVCRATSRLGEHDYRLLTNNCEHFCRWCLFGVGRSEQVEACMHNPIHAMATLMMLVVCVMNTRWHLAALGLAARSRVAASGIAA